MLTRGPSHGPSTEVLICIFEEKGTENISAYCSKKSCPLIRGLIKSHQKLPVKKGVLNTFWYNVSFSGLKMRLTDQSLKMDNKN